MDLTLLSMSAASSAERAGVVFVSPLALCINLIFSLRKLMDASSVTLDLGTMWFLMHLVRKVRRLV